MPAAPRRDVVATSSQVSECGRHYGVMMERFPYASIAPISTALPAVQSPCGATASVERAPTSCAPLKTTDSNSCSGWRDLCSLQLQLQASRRRAPPTCSEAWSRPSAAPGHPPTLAHRLPCTVQSLHACLRLRRPPPSRSRAHSSLTTQHSYIDTSSVGSVVMVVRHVSVRVSDCSGRAYLQCDGLDVHQRKLSSFFGKTKVTHAKMEPTLS